MTGHLSQIIFTIDRTICGHAIAIPGPASSEWLVLLNALLLVIPALATFGCIVAAGYMLVRPGERNPDHPKYRILNADR